MKLPLVLKDQQARNAIYCWKVLATSGASETGLTAYGQLEGPVKLYVINSFFVGNMSSPTRNPWHVWMFLGWLASTLSGLGAIFYGVVIFFAALTTHRRYLRAPSSQFEDLSMAQGVAREGILYGLSIIVLGLLLMAIGKYIARIQDRISTMESRRRDMLLHSKRNIGL